MSTPRLDDIGRDALRDVAADIITDFRGSCNRKLSTRKEMRWGSKGSLALVNIRSEGRPLVRSRTELRRRHYRVHQARTAVVRSPRRSTTPAAMCIEVAQWTGNEPALPRTTAERR